MDFIKGIFDMDFGALVPELDTVLGMVRPVLTLLLLAGPLVLLTLGLLYLFKPASEANYKFGFRTYYGMGSVEAWRFTQKIAGLAYSGLGGLLLIIMVIVTICFGGKNAYQMASTAITCLLWQVGLILAAHLAVAILVRKFFNADGTRRENSSF